MVIRKKAGDILSRGQLLVLLAVWELIIVFLFHRMESGEAALLIIAIPHQLFAFVAACFGLKATEVITLTPEGIGRRKFLREHKYAWSEIQQAGIWLNDCRCYQYWMLALVPPNGIRHTQNDVWDNHVAFKYTGKRNILFPMSEEARKIVEQYYGPLDFDLSDGRDEKSVVID